LFSLWSISTSLMVHIDNVFVKLSNSVMMHVPPLKTKNK
jgi:hypothetical protein